MQNFKPASERQLDFLRSKGYQGNLEGLTSAEASELISQMTGKAPVQQQPSVAPENYDPFANHINAAPTPQPAPRQQMSVQASKGLEIETSLGDKIQLTRELVEKYVCKDLSEAEYSYLSAVCKNYNLNPYLKEIYAIKFNNQPATFIIDYKVLQQAADNDPRYDGMETGILYIGKDGVEHERQGQFVLEGETFIAGWCKVFRKDRTRANKVYAPYAECVNTTKDGNPNSNWSKRPIFMTVKVAKTWALRETFPNWFSPNTYTSDEIEPSEEFKQNSIDGVINVQKEQTGKKSLFEDENGVVMEDVNI